MRLYPPNKDGNVLQEKQNYKELNLENEIQTKTVIKNKNKE